MLDKPKPQWSSIRKQLLLLDHNELIAQIKDMYALSAENRRFLEFRFTQEHEQVEAVLADYNQEIEYCFFESGTSPMNYPGSEMHAVRSVNTEKLQRILSEHWI